MKIPHEELGTRITEAMQDLEIIRRNKMGLYYCQKCDSYYCHHSVPCEDHNGELICENCSQEIEEGEEEIK